MAKLSIEYHPEARAEAEAAFDWYLNRSESAATQFQTELESAHQAIRTSPDQWAEYLNETRRYQLNRYPFVVVYRKRISRIEIIAVAHGRRKPGYWSNRLR